MKKSSLPERVQSVEPHVISGLVSSPLMSVEEQAKLLSQIPRNLTPEEVASIGLLAFNTVSPEDGIINGDRRERQVVSHLAGLALAYDRDILTAKSVAEHLKNRPGLLNTLAARRLNKQLKKIDETN